ncbi:MAG: glucosaminidase domain-containing protein [Fluviicola sp.]|nr:glucosaminidase domain-containing protein [Fluviicola sp.]
MRSITLSISLSLTAFLFGKEPVKPMSQADYVSIWSNVAVEHMQDYRIPASITLAQGILESGNGNSPLATQANNHFGIKCHEWTGEKMYFDDDQKQECFRKYPNADDSYKDHSLFLTTKPRYKTLFQLPVDDYKSWANGLKTAGYATSSTYATKLIDLIERLKLYEYDEKTPANLGKELLAKEIESSKPTKAQSIDADAAVYKAHAVKTHKNDLNYIVARKGDTYYKISQELKVAMWQLYKYNDFGPKKDLLEEGDIIYLEPKRLKAKDKNASYITKREMTIREISQIEGIKVSSLMKLNALTSEESIVPKGQKVLLR